ncbi:MAG TPA: hypothetical protein VIV66_12530 [Pyrinomonadaceae bacterium]
MKKQASIAFMMLSLMFSVAATIVRAQTNSHVMRITIPFEFVVRDKTLPPGDYIIKRSFSDRPEMLLIRNLDGDMSENVLTSNVQSKTPLSVSKLIFQRYGNRYFLSQIWNAGDSAGRDLPKSGRERSVALELAKNTVERQQTVTLIAHQR